MSKFHRLISSIPELSIAEKQSILTLIGNEEDPQLINEIEDYDDFIYFLKNKLKMKLSYTNNLFSVYFNDQTICIIYKIGGIYKYTSFSCAFIYEKRQEKRKQIYLSLFYQHKLDKTYDYTIVKIYAGNNLVINTTNNYKEVCVKISKNDLFKYIYNLHDILNLQYPKYKLVEKLNNNHPYIKEYLKNYNEVLNTVNEIPVNGMNDISNTIVEYMM